MATPSVAAIIIGAITSITICLMLILFSLFLMHRRRQRAIFIISLAQEEANRRRRKRKKAGLRRWEIESACPEAIVSIISNTVSSPTVHSQQDHPKQYQSAMAALRSANLLPDLPSPHSENDLSKQPASYKLKSLTPPPLAAPLSDTLDFAAPDAFASPNARSFIVVDVNALTPNHPCEASHNGALKPAADALPEDDVTNIPIVPSHVATLPHADEICVICLDDIEVGHRVRILPCGHLYHSQCIRMWLRRKNACPCCAEKVVKHRSKKQDADATPHDQIAAPDDNDLSHDHSERRRHHHHHHLHHHHHHHHHQHTHSFDHASATNNRSQTDESMPDGDHSTQPLSMPLTPTNAQRPERHDSMQYNRRTAIKTIHSRGRALQVYTSTTNSDGVDHVTCETVRPSGLTRRFMDQSQTSELFLQLQDVPLHDSSLSLNASSIAGWSDAHSDAPDSSDVPDSSNRPASTNSASELPASPPHPHPRNPDYADV